MCNAVLRVELPPDVCYANDILVLAGREKTFERIVRLAELSRVDEKSRSCVASRTTIGPWFRKLPREIARFSIPFSDVAVQVGQYLRYLDLDLEGR